MKHVNYSLYQKTNTVLLIETNFLKQPGTFSVLAPKAGLLCSLGGSVGLTETGVDGGEFSLFSSSSNTMGFSSGPH